MRKKFFLSYLKQPRIFQKRKVLYINWVFLGRILKKTIIIIEICSLEFVKVKNIHVKPNKFKFGTERSIIIIAIITIILLLLLLLYYYITILTCTKSVSTIFHITFINFYDFLLPSITFSQCLPTCYHLPSPFTNFSPTFYQPHQFLCY